MSYPFKNGGVVIPKDRKDDIASIKEWLKKQQYLPKISDEFIYLFLHSNYYSIERTKNTIETYFVLRTENRDLFENWDPEKMIVGFEKYELAPLSKTTPDGYKVIIYRLRDTDPAKMDICECLRVFLSFNDVRISEDGLTQGYLVVFDMKGCSLAHLAKVSTCINYLRVFMQYIQEGHPVRLKGVHVINSLWFTDKIMSIIKPFLQSELMQLIHFHTTLETLQPFVPLDLLTEEYGGDAKPMSLMNEEHYKMMRREYGKWLIGLGNMTADLKQRPQKTKQDVMQGSFRSLSID